MALQSNIWQGGKVEYTSEDCHASKQASGLDACQTRIIIFVQWHVSVYYQNRDIQVHGVFKSRTAVRRSDGHLEKCQFPEILPLIFMNVIMEA